MKRLPPLDAHAHVDTQIDAVEITELNAFVMAVTRSLDEAGSAVRRSDDWAIWGVGCHPGLKKAQDGFDAVRFRELIQSTSFVGELGLDGKSRVPLAQQSETLSSALQILAEAPRITSLHSYAATEEILELLAPCPPPGMILHWWLGDPGQTRRAAEMGCFFSVNASSAKRMDLLASIPPERLLTETDHPFGDRRKGPSRPGLVDDVERLIGSCLHRSVYDVRRLVWDNFTQLVRDTGCRSFLPRLIRIALAATI